MGDYYNLARRTIEIILPEGHIIPPEAFWQYNFLWPEGTGVIITLLIGWLEKGQWKTALGRDNSHCPRVGQ